MENLNAIKKRIKSVDDISQMTNAMQLVSSAKMRRSLALHDSVYPFFSLCAESMQEIRNNTEKIDNPFFRLEQKKEGDTWKIGYFVLSGDQGLAGAYNNNMVKITQEHVHSKILENTSKNMKTEYKLFVFGKLAREKLMRLGYNVDPEFSFPISEPNYYQAKRVASIIRRKFLAEEFDLIYLIYTRMESASNMVPDAVRLVPVDNKSLESLVPSDAQDCGIALEKGSKMEYLPDPEMVFDYLIDTYINAVVYGAMVDAYASEQTARLTAMDNATKNAEDMMKKLLLISNRARQAKITNELTEIINGAEQAGNL
ncbi:MAG: ATP synthase F1 subunit gamma [Clostridiales bacterium]|nr:ATP synthase F1 subunit gamma [Clostridiales bacterium]